MQNSPNIHILSLKFFLFIRPFFERFFSLRVAVFLASTVGLTAQAQIIAPSTGATTAPSSGAVTSPGTIRSGTTTPSTGQPGRVTLPAGVNSSNLPANAQQQLNQLNNQRNNGQTQGQQNGQSGRSNASNADPTAADPNNPNQANDPNQPTDPNQQTDNTRVKSEEDRVREEARQKVFGYALFNDPAMKATFQPNVNMATPRNYIIGPGDELRIRLYGYSEADYTQKVSPEGAVYVAQGSGIGPIQVSGLTIEQAKARLAGRLTSKFAGLKNSSYGPQNTFLELSLGEIRSIRVTVTGDAVRPGTYSISSLSTAMNAIYQAGGPNDMVHIGKCSSSGIIVS